MTDPTFPELTPPYLQLIEKVVKSRVVPTLMNFSYEDLGSSNSAASRPPAGAPTRSWRRRCEWLVRNYNYPEAEQSLFAPAYYCGGCGRPRLAAALRAVAEQLVPQMYVPERFYSGEDFEEYARQMTRQHLLAIADELEG
jgi:hypothetical protein